MNSTRLATINILSNISRIDNSSRNERGHACMIDMNDTHQYLFLEVEKIRPENASLEIEARAEESIL